MRRAIKLLPLLLVLSSGCVVCVAHAAEPQAQYVIVEGMRLSDPRFTPGEARPLAENAVCATKWGKDERHVTLKMKRTVCGLYGETEGCPGRGFEVDHLISRELGGADTIANLFPQPIGQARLKDRLENRLHREVCAGAISLHAAQIEIAKNWWTAFKKRFGEDK